MADEEVVRLRRLLAESQRALVLVCEVNLRLVKMAESAEVVTGPNSADEIYRALNRRQREMAAKGAEDAAVEAAKARLRADAPVGTVMHFGVDMAAEGAERSVVEGADERPDICPACRCRVPFHRPGCARYEGKAEDATVCPLCGRSPCASTCPGFICRECGVVAPFHLPGCERGKGSKA